MDYLYHALNVHMRNEEMKVDVVITNRVVYFSIFLIFVMLAVNYLGTIYLKNYFRKRKLI
jgi:hypothetical protein